MAGFDDQASCNDRIQSDKDREQRSDQEASRREWTARESAAAHFLHGSSSAPSGRTSGSAAYPGPATPTPTCDQQYRESLDRLAQFVRGAPAIASQPTLIESVVHAGVPWGPNLPFLGGVLENRLHMIDFALRDCDRLDAQGVPSIRDVSGGMEHLRLLSAIRRELEWMRAIVVHWQAGVEKLKRKLPREPTSGESS
jgi:hypothetical protein